MIFGNPQSASFRGSDVYLFPFEGSRILHSMSSELLFYSYDFTKQSQAKHIKYFSMLFLLNTNNFLPLLFYTLPSPRGGGAPRVQPQSSSDIS